MLHRPSPNFGPRRDGLTPTIIVLHYTAMPSAEAALERLCDPAAEVSAHYLIAKSGVVTRLVAEAERAWHAGTGEWCGQHDINSRSIGIELDNAGDHPFPDPQMIALEVLLEDIRSRWPIPPENIIGHSDMAPGRKSDPGPRFDWARLARRGLAGPTRPPQDQTCFTTAARAAGFTADVASEVLLETTRLRFAPWRRGPQCADDLKLYHPI
ncbi:N-acetylmuramoyl-L-alanine amidase [Roseobacter weihaiensis]|uniref:N-acetylmuramoyl-L-alanine amidase n=1 Tax=Roseobacter weihaiensis TaxID=2763262 RepID=UPI001D0B29D7|nr:N-acetylmuramoyl-L-alanine amidase [Roseobacter sp. H9]